MLRAGRSGVRIPEEQRDLLFFEASRPAVGPTESLIPRVKVKVQFTLQQATKAQRWNRGIALLFL